MVTNHRPQVRGTDEGIWRRLRLVPFDVIIPLAEQDPHLPSKLAAEADGILRWLIDGYTEWRSHGLDDPVTVTTATSGYRAEEDALGRFLDQGTHRSPLVAVRSSVLFAQWQRWAGAEGVDQGTQTAFSRELGDRGYQIEKSHGQMVVRGLALKTEQEER